MELQYENDLLIVDELIYDPSLPNAVVVRIGDEHYMLNNAARGRVGESDLRPYKRTVNKDWRRMGNYYYLIYKLIPRGGFKVPLGRPITADEMKAVVEKYGLAEDDISAEFEDKKGGIYGDKYAKSYRSVQVRVPEDKAIPLESELQAKGIQAGNTAPGRVNIRTDWGGAREGAGRPPVEDKRTSRSIKFSDAEWEAVKRKAEAAGKTISDYIRAKALES